MVGFHNDSSNPSAAVWTECRSNLGRPPSQLGGWKGTSRALESIVEFHMIYWPGIHYVCSIIVL